MDVQNTCSEWVRSMTSVVEYQYWVFKIRSIFAQKWIALKEIFVFFEMEAFRLLGLCTWDLTADIVHNETSLYSSISKSTKKSFKPGHLYAKIILILNTQNWYSTTEVMLLDRLSYFLFPLPFHWLFSCTISHDYQI